MHTFTGNQFPIIILLIDSFLTSIVGSTYLTIKFIGISQCQFNNSVILVDL